MVKPKDYKWPEHFTIGVLPPLGGLETPYVVKKWTDVFAKDTGMKIHLAVASDKPTKFKWAHYGLVNMADGGGEEWNQLLKGVGRYGSRDCGPFPLRIVWVLSQYDSGFIVRGDSKIKTIYDVKPGVRVVDMRSYLDSQSNVEGMLAWAGIKNLEKDVKWVSAHSTEEKAQLVVEGKADIAFAVPSSPITEKAERNPHGIRWIELNSEKDPEGAKRFWDKCCLIDFGPMFRGVKSARGVCSMIGIDQECCNAGADPELVYNVAKWLHENWDRYRDLHPWLAQTTLGNLMTRIDTTFIPCHEGLIKYLKELKLWTPEHEKRQKQNVELIDRYCEAWQKALWLADEKDIVVNAGNKEWVELWENYKKQQSLPPFIYPPSLGKGKAFKKQQG